MNMAAATACPQQDITDDGNVVIKAKNITALGTGRGRINDRFTLRNAIDADVEKTADTGTENKREYFEQVK